MARSSIARVGMATCAPLLFAALVGCAQYTAQPGQPVPRIGDAIVVCGERYHTGARVVLWTDPGGYDAYRIHRHFEPQELAPSRPVSDNLTRFNRRQFDERIGPHVDLALLDRVAAEGWTLPDLQQVVDQFVVHYDVCGTSQQCFKVLHDIRGLSVHFMLDQDGTIYQTLDLKERAWHAGSHNGRSIGIEIAHIGAYSTDHPRLDEWYDVDAQGPYVVLPDYLHPPGFLTPDFVPRPARAELIIGPVQRTTKAQYDYTPEQWAALIKLTATLCQVLPQIQPQCPRDEHGAVITHVLDDEQRLHFQGLVGHYHLTRGKIDPGPAFDWERFIAEVQAELRRRGAAV